MNKNIFLLILIFISSSCAKSVYYAYEKNGDYCTLEVTKKEEVIYRAYYDDNYNKEYGEGWHDNSLGYITSNIYIYSRDGLVEEFTSIEEDFDMYLLNTNTKKFIFCISDVFTKKKNGITYIKRNKDSLDLLWTPNIKANLLKEACYAENYITWFAPYMKRVKKIDYKKFNSPQIKTKHLKNPKNAPKVSD